MSGAGGEALDFAVTSGTQSGLLREAAFAPELLFERYERQKREHLRTGGLCEGAGFKFVPMIIEAHGGGWSPTARRVLDWIAGELAAASGEDKGTVSLRVAQRISCILHRENACAILRWAGGPSTPPPVSGWATAGDAWQ